MTRRRPALACAAMALLAARAAGAQPRTFPSRDVRVDVDVAADATARVRETYTLTASLDAADFQILDAPCAPVGPIASEVGDRVVDLDRARREPWTTLLARGVEAAAGSVWRLEYTVRTSGGEATIPIVFPAATLERIADTRGAAVTIAVAIAGEGEPTLPSFERDAGRRTWHARLLALPSIVRVRVPPSAPVPCGAAPAGTSGGLEWRFWIFVATMAIWVPLYLWWFGRRRPGEDD